MSGPTGLNWPQNKIYRFILRKFQKGYYTVMTNRAPAVLTKKQKVFDTHPIVAAAAYSAKSLVVCKTGKLHRSHGQRKFWQKHR